MSCILAVDKKLHLIIGALIMLLFAPINILLGSILVVVLGLGKELIWDKMLKRGTPDAKDFIATCIGGMIALIYVVILNIII